MSSDIVSVVEHCICSRVVLLQEYNAVLVKDRYLFSFTDQTGAKSHNPFGTPQQLLKLDLPLLTERFPSFAFHSSVRNLGVFLDSTLTFSEHVANLTRSTIVLFPPEAS